MRRAGIELVIMFGSGVGAKNLADELFRTQLHGTNSRWGGARRCPPHALQCLYLLPSGFTLIVDLLFTCPPGGGRAYNKSMAGMQHQGDPPPD